MKMTTICVLSSYLVQCAAVAAAPRAKGTLIEDFESKSEHSKVWVVNMPEDSASAAITDQDAAEGKRSLAVNFKFTAQGQYFGVPVPVAIEKPFRTLRFQLRGDGSNVRYGLYVMDKSGETHKYHEAGRMRVDYRGWKEVAVDLTAGHETWGGDKNGTIDYPISGLTFEMSTPGGPAADAIASGQIAFDEIVADAEGLVAQTYEQVISVTSPAYCSDIEGNTPIRVAAPGFESLSVKAWQAGGKFGRPVTVATVKLDAAGNGSFTFPADEFPHGPLTITISGDNGQVKDNCYLQLYNKSGTAWNAGLPQDPPAAKGLKLQFADDFDGPLSIGAGPTFRYYDHKPPRGQMDFSFPLQFVSHDKPNTPFAQVDTYLRIRASEKSRSAGIISSLQSDGSGFKISAPAYFECRFVGPNAIGSWPAFWLMTDSLSNGQDKDDKAPCDELDVIEAYGGEGPKQPNSFDKYMISPHCWNQGDEGHEIQEKAVKQLKRPTEMSKVGIPSTWYETFHTYGCLITETETIYYCDDIEVGRHPTLPLSKEKPLFFMINMATGGGWPVDLSRYSGEIDMYVDYVRVYGKAE
jgi:hypothetical protein